LLKARSRKISLVLVLAMLMTMFAGLGTAGAADMYSVGSVPTIEADADNQKLASIIVTAYNFEDTNATPTVMDVVYGNTDAGFVVKLPADFVITKVGTNGSFDAAETFNPGDADTYAEITPFTDKGSAEAKVYVVATGQKNRVKVFVASSATIEELKFTIPLEVSTPTSIPDEVKAGIAKEPGSVFNDNYGIVVATATQGSVQAIANDSITVVAKDNKVTFSVRANTADALDKFNVKLPAGFTWSDAKMTKAGKADVVGTDADQGRTMKFTFSGDNKGIWTFEGYFDVDDSRAKFGDVVLTLSGSGVNPSSITIGTYADFGIEVTTSDVPTVLAGLSELEIADITIKETAAGSLVNGRTVYMTLPDGVRWLAEEDEPGVLTLVVEDVDTTGSLSLDATDITVYKNKKGQARFVVDNTAEKKGSIKIEAAQIEVAPDFVGPVNVKITGSAGIEEEVKVAEVIAPITVQADVTDVKIGLQAQPGGNIVITEAEAEALNATFEGEDAYLVLKAPLAVQWAKVPTIKVIEGDVELGTATRSDENRILRIRIKETSTVASKIEISDIAWTVDRTVPEGAMKVSVLGDAVIQLKEGFTNRGTVTSFVAANVVTPAPGETVGNGEFRIGSNIYYVGGVAKVMDVAPYIKGSRTYVPMRYLGEILGAEVVWDDAARTVTLTKGDTTVVFTIGSTTYTVNGEAKTADVAPEISNDRTMLPARFVAEAFGATVGWDAASQTVLIQK